MGSVRLESALERLRRRRVGEVLEADGVGLAGVLAQDAAVAADVRVALVAAEVELERLVDAKRAVGGDPSPAGAHVERPGENRIALGARERDRELDREPRCGPALRMGHGGHRTRSCTRFVRWCVAVATGASTEVRTQIQVRWRDLDLLGHLNQSVYHEFL